MTKELAQKEVERRKEELEKYCGATVFVEERE